MAGDEETFQIQDYDYGDDATNNVEEADPVTQNGAGSGCMYPFEAAQVLSVDTSGFNDSSP